MNAGEIAQIVAALAIVAGAAYWGGELRTLTRHLVQGQQDHEHRLRKLERNPRGERIPVHRA